MENRLKVLDLFSGIGGFALGLERAGMETVAFCDIEPFCQQVLQVHWPDVPIAEDICRLNYEDGALKYAGRIIYQGRIDVVCGGFPCQPFSIAGRKKGSADHRDLWPEMFRLIQQTQPTWVIGENVAHFVRMAFTRTKADLESESYTVQPFIIPACAIGAPHRRDRVWIVAYAGDQRCERRQHNRQEGSVLHDEVRLATKDQRSGNQGKHRAGAAGSAATYHRGKRTQRHGTESLRRERAFSWCEDVRRIEDYFNRPDLPQPLICRSDDGFSTRVDRLKALGNAVVPQIPEMIGRAIIQTMQEQ